MINRRHARDPRLHAEIAAYIAQYREAGAASAKLQAQVLAAFPIADGNDFAIGLSLANGHRRVGDG